MRKYTKFLRVVSFLTAILLLSLTAMGLYSPVLQTKSFDWLDDAPWSTRRITQTTSFSMDDFISHGDNTYSYTFTVSPQVYDTDTYISPVYPSFSASLYCAETSIGDTEELSNYNYCFTVSTAGGSSAFRNSLSNSPIINYPLPVSDYYTVTVYFLLPPSYNTAVVRGTFALSYDIYYKDPISTTQTVLPPEWLTNTTQTYTTAVNFDTVTVTLPEDSSERIEQTLELPQKITSCFDFLIALFSRFFELKYVPTLTFIFLVISFGIWLLH